MKKHIRKKQPLNKSKRIFGRVYKRHDKVTSASLLSILPPFHFLCKLSPPKFFFPFPLNFAGKSINPNAIIKNFNFLSPLITN